MQEKEKNQNWGVNDYRKNLSADTITKYLAIFGVNLLSFKPFQNALQFTNQEEEIIKTFQTSKIVKFANMIVSSQTKMAAFRSLLETSYLRGSFPYKLEFRFGYPKTTPQLLTSLPQTQKCLNFRILVQMFLSSVQTKVFWMSDMEVIRMTQISENSKFRKKDTENLFGRIAQEEKNLYTDSSYSLSRQLTFSVWISYQSQIQFFINIWILLEELDYYHVISMDYLSSRSLAFVQMNRIECEQVDYQQYLLNKRNWENENLSKLKGVNPVNQLEERPDVMERLNSVISESRDWDHLALDNLSNSQVNSSISGKHDQSLSSIGKQIFLKYLERNNSSFNLLQLNRFNQKKSCSTSSRQLIIEYSSVIYGKLIYDTDILRLTEFEDGNQSQLIFSTVTKGDLFLSKDVVMKSKLSWWLKSHMDQFPLACQTQAQEEILQLEQMEMEQQHQDISQQLQVLPKIKKTVKGSKKNSKRMPKRSEWVLSKFNQIKGIEVELSLMGIRKLCGKPFIIIS